MRSMQPGPFLYFPSVPSLLVAQHAWHMQGIDSNIVGDTLSRWVENLRPARPPLPKQREDNGEPSVHLQSEPREPQAEHHSTV